jgi:hypothetical protein
MTTTVPTPSVSFVPVPAIPLAGSPPASSPLPYLAPGQAPDNDAAATRSPENDHAAYARLLHHPRIPKFLDERLRGSGLQRDDKDELISAVREKLWNRRHDPRRPTTLPRVLGLGRKILDAKLVDFCRHQDVVREKIRDAPRVAQDDLPPRNEPHDQPNYVEELRPPRSMRADDALETRQRMDFVNELAPKIGMTRDDVEVMYAMTWDCDQTTWEELAAERGERPGELRQRIRRLQEKVRKAWARRIAPQVLLTLLILAMLVLYAMTLLGPARNPPPPAPLPEPTVHAEAPVTPAPTTTAELPPEAPEGLKPHLK